MLTIILFACSNKQDTARAADSEIQTPFSTQAQATSCISEDDLVYGNDGFSSYTEDAMRDLV